MLSACLKGLNGKIYLSIRLRMKSSIELHLCNQALFERSPKVGSELVLYPKWYIKGYHDTSLSHNIHFGIIFNPISRLHRIEVEDLIILPTMTQMESCSFLFLGRPTIKSIVIASRHKMIGLNLLEIGTLHHKLRNILLHSFPPIDILELMIHFGGT